MFQRRHKYIQALQRFPPDKQGEKIWGVMTGTRHTLVSFLHSCRRTELGENFSKLYI
jgi:hypothetical protein